LSLTEGSGKLLNYMAAALPTVAFDTPVAREYLGIHGLFAKSGDVESLAQKLSSALFSKDVRPESAITPTADYGLGRGLRQRALQHFEWSHAGHRIVETYRRLVGEPPSSHSDSRSPKVLPESIS